MGKKNSVVAVYASHELAEAAVCELQKDGFDMKDLSIVGRDYHTEEHAVGYYNAGDRMVRWGGAGAVWGGLWGMLFGAAFFWVPGVGPVLVAGPLVAMIVWGIEGAAVAGGLSALGAALYGLGIPEDSIVEYETEVKQGKFLLVAHGKSHDVKRARDLLGHTSATTTTMHAKPVLAGV